MLSRVSTSIAPLWWKFDTTMSYRRCLPNFTSGTSHRWLGIGHNGNWRMLHVRAFAAESQLLNPHQPPLLISTRCLAGSLWTRTRPPQACALHFCSHSSTTGLVTSELPGGWVLGRCGDPTRSPEHLLQRTVALLWGYLRRSPCAARSPHQGPHAQQAPGSLAG